MDDAAINKRLTDLDTERLAAFLANRDDVFFKEFNERIEKTVVDVWPHIKQELTLQNAYILSQGTVLRLLTRDFATSDLFRQLFLQEKNKPLFDKLNAELVANRRRQQARTATSAHSDATGGANAGNPRGQAKKSAAAAPPRSPARGGDGTAQQTGTTAAQGAAIPAENTSGAPNNGARTGNEGATPTPQTNEAGDTPTPTPIVGPAIWCFNCGEEFPKQPETPGVADMKCEYDFRCQDCKRSAIDGHDAYCHICFGDDYDRHTLTLITCDARGCPRGAHAECAGLEAVPPDDWFCPDCELRQGRLVLVRAPAGNGRSGKTELWPAVKTTIEKDNGSVLCNYFHRNYFVWAKEEDIVSYARNKGVSTEKGFAHAVELAEAYKKNKILVPRNLKGQVLVNNRKTLKASRPVELRKGEVAPAARATRAAAIKKNDSEDEEDDESEKPKPRLPLASKKAAKKPARKPAAKRPSAAPAAAAAPAKKPAGRPPPRKRQASESDSDDAAPLAKRPRTEGEAASKQASAVSLSIVPLAAATNNAPPAVPVPAPVVKVQPKHEPAWSPDW